MHLQTCTCSVDVWMDIICKDVNGFHFGLQDGTYTVGDKYGIEAACGDSIKLINNVSLAHGRCRPCT